MFYRHSTIRIVGPAAVSTDARPDARTSANQIGALCFLYPDAGVAMVREHSLDTERRQFLGVLDDFVNDW